MSPTPTLEQHLMWDDIAILLRYLLMLSFNNSLDGKQNSYSISLLCISSLRRADYSVSTELFSISGLLFSTSLCFKFYEAVIIIANF